MNISLGAIKHVYSTWGVRSAGTGPASVDKCTSTPGVYLAGAENFWDGGMRVEEGRIKGVEDGGSLCCQIITFLPIQASSQHGHP